MYKRQPLAVPDEPLTLKVFDLPATGIIPSCVVSCELWNGKERVGSWQLAVQASIWRDIPVAHSALTRGQLLKDADVTLERRDVLVPVSYTHLDVYKRQGLR